MEKEQPTETDLYVNLQKPLEIRRNILECSKDVLMVMERLDRIKALRKQKTDAVQQLKVQIGELNILVSKLAEQLPDYKLFVKEQKKHASQQEKPQKTKKSKKGKKTKQKPTKKTRPKTDVKASLRKVESKLSHLRK